MWRPPPVFTTRTTACGKKIVYEPHRVSIETPADTGVERVFARTLSTFGFQLNSLKKGITDGLDGALGVPFKHMVRQMWNQVEAGVRAVPLLWSNILQNLGKLGYWHKQQVDFDMKKFTELFRVIMTDADHSDLSAAIMGDGAAPVKLLPKEKPVAATKTSLPKKPVQVISAWRVLTGTAFAAASMIGRPLVERWQCNCNFCDVDVLDTMDHRMFECDLAKCAWAWARQVLDAASLHYEGTAAGMWLYGGSTSIHDERVVTTLRGAFFEALPAVQRRLGAGEEAVVATTLGQMIRARMLSEIQRDIFYVSDAFERSYDARDRKMGRPEDRGAVLAVWRGLVQHASARDGGLVGVLPPVDIEETP